MNCPTHATLEDGQVFDWFTVRKSRPNECVQAPYWKGGAAPAGELVAEMWEQFAEYPFLTGDVYDVRLVGGQLFVCCPPTLWEPEPLHPVKEVVSQIVDRLTSKARERAKVI